MAGDTGTVLFLHGRTPTVQDGIDPRVIGWKGIARSGLALLPTPYHETVQITNQVVLQQHTTY